MCLCAAFVCAVHILLVRIECLGGPKGVVLHGASMLYDSLGVRPSNDSFWPLLEP